MPCHSGGAGVAATQGEAIGQHLSVQQQALLGCGPFFGTNCDDSGLDLLNAEASTLLQAWPGFEGTENPAGGVNFKSGLAGASLPTQWTTTNTKFDPTNPVPLGRTLRADGQDRQQPGTLFFQGGPVGTTTVVVNNDYQNKVLPGARRALLVDAGGRLVANPDYRPEQDGCIGGPAFYGSLGLTSAFPAACAASGSANNPLHALRHPLSDRGGSAQFFASEMAAVSWNFLMLLAINDSRFESRDPFSVCKPDPTTRPSKNAAATACLLDGTGNPLPACTLATPQHCSTVRGIIGLAGVTRNIVRAGGNGTYGRRTFAWQSGGEAVLAFERRNVLGFSFDFAEDVTKSNIGFEATWIPGIPRGDSLAYSGVSKADDYNITLSIDRPTFINFLNANRTFFFNGQFFFQYRDGYEKSFGGEGPWNLLATFSILAGFFQDRLLPNVTFVYDVQTRSSAVLPQIQYRYTEAFSIVVGAQFFAGDPDLRPISINGLGPVSNQQGPRANLGQVDNGVSIVRSIDNFFVRLRYAF